MSAARSRTPARRGEGERLREEILEAAGRLMAVAADEADVSMRRIADAVGCAPPAIYLHFPDRQSLIYAVCDRHFLRLIAEIDAAEAGVADAPGRLRAIAHAYVRFGVANPEPYRVLFMSRGELVPPFDLEADRPGMDAFRHLLATVEDCIADGTLAGEPLAIATACWTVVHGVVSLAVATPGYPFTDLAAFVDLLVDATLRGFAG